MQESIKQNVRRVIWLQLLVTIVVAVFWAFSSLAASVSTILGGLACIGPSFFFARYFFAQIHKDPLNIIKSFYFGELLKLTLSVALLLVIYKGLHISLLPLLTGFIAAQFGFWLGPMLGLTNIKASQS